MLLCSLLMTFIMASASELLSNKLIKSIISSPMSFFDSTPMGHILSRCSRVTDNFSV